MSYKEIKVIPAEDEDTTIAQVYSKGLEYSALDKDNKMLMPWIYCKDFLSDLIWSTINKKPAGIYGIKVDPEKHIAPLDNFQLIVRHAGLKKQDLISGLENSVNLINDYFSKAGKFKPVTIAGTAKVDDKTSVILNVPKSYFIAPPLFSLFTLLIRAGVHYGEKGEKNPLAYMVLVQTESANWNRLSNNDGSFIKSAWALIRSMYSDGVKQFFDKDIKGNWPSHLSVGTVHNNTGIKAYATGGAIGEMFDEYMNRAYPEPKEAKAVAAKL